LFYIFLALSQLQNIFSNLQPEEVRQALENANGCIETATATLLDESGKYAMKAKRFLEFLLAIH
jgi:hypothetical protein